MEPVKKIIILASGEGTTCEYILQQMANSALSAEVVAIVVDRVCGATQVAKKHKIPCVVIKPIKGVDRSHWDQKLYQYLKAAKPDYILMLGFLRQLGPRVVKGFEDKIINTHPSLLPAYGGKGMYGSRIHQSVVANGEKKTGVTVHFVNENYDEGKILAQKEIDILPGEKAEELESRVKDIEKGFLVETLSKILI